MTGLSESRLAEIAASEAAASKGPWLQGIDGYSVSGPDGGAFSDLQVSIDVGDPADAVFIADARTAVPELLEDNARLRALVATLERDSATPADPICGSRCPTHEHVCQRRPHPLASELSLRDPAALDPYCRDRHKKTPDSCTWDRERNGRLVGHGGQLEIMRTAIERDGGEWTTGRVKRLFHRDARLTHVLRVTIRRHLARLHAEGFLDLRETPGRRFYIRSEGTRYDVLG